MKGEGHKRLKKPQILVIFLLAIHTAINPLVGSSDSKTLGRKRLWLLHL